MPSIPDTLRTTAARCPDREALVFGSARRSYREFPPGGGANRRGARRFRHRPRRAGAADVAQQRRVRDRRLRRAPDGRDPGPANPRNAPPELAHLITDSGAVAVLYAPELAGVVAPGIAQSGASPPALTLPELAELATAGHPPVTHVPAESDDALLLYTSGTTGAPKGALFDHHRALWVAINVSGTAGYRDGDRTLHVAPALPRRAAVPDSVRGHRAGHDARHRGQVRARSGRRPDGAGAHLGVLRGADDVPVPAAAPGPHRPRPVRLAHRHVRRRAHAARLCPRPGQGPAAGRALPAVRADRGRAGRHLRRAGGRAGPPGRQRPLRAAQYRGPCASPRKEPTSHRARWAS